MIDRELLKAWQKDIVEFIEDTVWIPTPKGIQKLHLWDYQKEILKEATSLKDGKPSYRVLCLSMPKRNGKTMLGSLILTWKFITTFNCQGVVCSNSYTQAQNVLFDTFKDFIRCSPVLLELVKAENIFEDKILLPETKSKVVCLSAKLQTSFGYPITIGVVDEIHASEDNGEGLFQVLASQCADRDGQIILPSQASSKTNVLYRLYQGSKEDESVYFYYTQKNLSPLIAESFLISRQKQMLPSQFRAYHRNEWSEGGESLFNEEQILKCLDKEFSLSDLSGYVLGAGLDRALAFSKNADRTVLTFLAKGLREEKEVFYVVDSKIITFSDADSIKSALVEARQSYGLENVVSDVYQSADLHSWALSQGFKSELLHLSREAQMPIFNLLYRIIDEGRLKFSPDFELLKKELEVFSVDTSMNPPKFGGQPHDDAVYSLALALWSMRELEPAWTDFGEIIKSVNESPDRIMMEQFGRRNDDFKDRDFLNPLSTMF
ncbi:MAG: terminase large subunit, partial [Candidatus Omnitrophota bacterium]|nr:terminase large subunit [Candidatus Omnitrophota bacterium]